jgi:hypothetical protein
MPQPWKFLANSQQLLFSQKDSFQTEYQSPTQECCLFTTDFCPIRLPTFNLSAQAAQKTPLIILVSLPSCKKHHSSDAKSGHYLIMGYLWSYYPSHLPVVPSLWEALPYNIQHNTKQFHQSLKTIIKE